MRMRMQQSGCAAAGDPHGCSLREPPLTLPCSAAAVPGAVVTAAAPKDVLDGIDDPQGPPASCSGLLPGLARPQEQEGRRHQPSEEPQRHAVPAGEALDQAACCTRGADCSQLGNLLNTVRKLQEEPEAALARIFTSSQLRPGWCSPP